MQKIYQVKRTLLLSLLLLLVLAKLGFAPANVLAADGNRADAIVDSFRLPYTADSGYPYIDANNRTQVPLRLTCEAIGCQVAWDANRKEATISKGAVSVLVAIDSSTIYRNNQAIANDTTAVINPADGRTYLPIRVVLEAFGCKVNWDQANRTVLVDSQCSAAYAKSLETGAVARANYWPNFNAGLAACQSGAYPAAIPQLEQAVCDLSVYGGGDGLNGKYTNLALAFFNLGTCQAKVGNYDRAAASYLREADYWQLLHAEYSAAADSYNANQAEQMIIDARRRAEYCAAGISLYAVTNDASLSLVNHYGEAGESKNGILLGAYAEAEKALSGNYTTFSHYVGKTHGAYLIYYSVGANLEAQYGLKQYIRLAQESNTVLQIALQPLSGLDYVLSDQGKTWLENFAKYLATTGVPVYVRFAAEMNLESTPWFTGGARYIEAFRRVYTIIHQYAGNVAVVWSPNFYPTTNYETFYPGDDYCDYVGVSAYQNYSDALAATDPLGEGKVRQRFINSPAALYMLYGGKKPIIISEGAATFVSQEGSDVTAFANWQLKDFYTYLPILYPNVKAMFYFDSADSGAVIRNFMLSQNATLRSTYSSVIQSASYLSDYTAGAKLATYYVPLFGVSIPADTAQLCSYVNYIDNEAVASVSYQINGSKLGTAYTAPFTISCDLTAYRGMQDVEFLVSAYDSAGRLLLQRSFQADLR
ncbi:MAG: hypothetical protein LLG09_01055 [Negativicutes bacterium]|nr:hypothetical protein [Negativicutes bacterium]